MGKNLCQLYDRMHEAIDSDLAHTVEPLVSHLPKCEDVVVAYGRWPLSRIAPQGELYEKKFRPT